MKVGLAKPRVCFPLLIQKNRSPTVRQGDRPPSCYQDSSVESSEQKLKRRKTREFVAKTPESRYSAKTPAAPLAAPPDTSIAVGSAEVEPITGTPLIHNTPPIHCDVDYRALHESIPLMCFTLDRAFSVLSVNEFGAAELGYDPEELIGEPVYRVIHPDDQEGLRSHLQQAVLSQRLDPTPVMRWEIRKVHQDGTVLWVEETVRTVDLPTRETVLLVVCQDITERKLAAQQLRQYQEKLRALSCELTLAEEKERRRIGAGLHDQVGQLLGIARLKLDDLMTHEASQRLIGPLREVGELIDQAVSEIRSMTFELSSPVLYEIGFEAALEELARDMMERSGLPCWFRKDAQPKPVTLETELTVTGIVRELLWNVVKHAEAGNAWVTIERSGDRVRIEVADDGIGFGSGETERAWGAGKFVEGGGFGLFSARERLTCLGGSLEVESADGKGTRVVISVPIETTVPTETAEADLGRTEP